MTNKGKSEQKLKVKIYETDRHLNILLFMVHQDWVMIPFFPPLPSGSHRRHAALHGQSDHEERQS